MGAGDACFDVSWFFGRRPDHFHLMVELLREKLPFSNPDLFKERTFNNSIAIMLRSYTRAINLQEKRTGSLFQAHTKSICLNSIEISPAYFNTFSGTMVNVPISDYLIKCFNYIHENPLKHGKVAKIDDWEFSSWLDYYKSRGGTLINKERAVELGLVEIQSSDDRI